MESITLDDARTVIAGAEAKAQEIGQPMDIAVVDAGGNLKAHVRMDGALVGSIDIAINKAWTSVAFKLTTQDFGAGAQPGESIYGINTTNQGRAVIFGGGIPLERDGAIVGAIGVSSGTVDQDMAVAAAGVAALA
jgi:uncharacterized protein GlcG (DUF336 family)